MIDIEEFSFESNHLALRGNIDYTYILRTLIVLETQNIQATNDLETLANARVKALENPSNFLCMISKNEFELPKSIKIAKIPLIDFDKYNVKFPELLNLHSIKNEKNYENSQILFKEEKQDTYNQQWTIEEQRKLEELLVEFPPEQFEMRRFAKISRSLGNRTTKQVASRVQKYFKKLHAAGLPIPGRIPKARNFQKLSKFNKITFRPSTFFPTYNVPVSIPDEDEIIEPKSSIDFKRTDPLASNCTLQVSNFDRISASISESEDENILYKPTKIVEVNILKTLRTIKNDKIGNRLESIHFGYKCKSCCEQPILGTRWNCKTCSNINFCSDCLVTHAISNNEHPWNHKFMALRISKHKTFENKIDSDSDEHQFLTENSIDKDYLLSKFSKNQIYNYLDPNFIS